MGLTLKQKKTFKAISKINIKVASEPTIDKDIFYFLLLITDAPNNIIKTAIAPININCDVESKELIKPNKLEIPFPELIIGVDVGVGVGVGDTILLIVKVVFVT
jgi:hypothetical protein